MKLRFKVFMAAALFLIFNVITFAQGPPEPPPGGGQGGNNNAPGGGAPIGGGLGILLALGAAYGLKKVYQFNKNDNE
jgi:hypothetical protein